MARSNDHVTPHTNLAPIRRTVANNYGFSGDPKDLKYYVARQLNIPFSPGYNGSMPTRDAGRIGGNIGGPMVREMIRFAEAQLAAGVRPPADTGGPGNSTSDTFTAWSSR